MANRLKVTTEKKAVFLDMVVKTGGNVTKAAKAVGLAPKSLYEHRNKNDAFRSAWDEAVKQGADLLIEEAMRRAVKGVLDPVYQGGFCVGHKRQYSDSLLMFLIKGRRPEFKDSANIAINNHTETNVTLTVEERVKQRVNNLKERLGFDLQEAFGDTSGS
jgi:hypothetical protein